MWSRFGQHSPQQLLDRACINPASLLQTSISGCIASQGHKSLLKAQYLKPTLLDIQEVEVQGCFVIENELMKLMIYEVYVTISTPGYLDVHVCADSFCTDCVCERGISLFNTYQYNIQDTINLNPNYAVFHINFLVRSGEQPIASASINLACQELGAVSLAQTYQTDQYGQAKKIFDSSFKRKINYQCGAFAQKDPEGVDYLTFNLQDNLNITLNLKPYDQQKNKQESKIIGKVLSKSQPLSGVGVRFEFSGTSGSVTTDENGNFTISAILNEAVLMHLWMTKIGFKQQELSFKTPEPPFTEYLAAVNLVQQDQRVTIFLLIEGVLLTIFDDPIVTAQIEFRCRDRKILDLQTDEHGRFVLNDSLLTVGEQCALTVTRRQFEDYTINLEIGDELFQSELLKGTIKKENGATYISSQKNRIFISPKPLKIQIVAWMKSFTGQVNVWLSQLRFGDQIASPKLNQTLHLASSMTLTQANEIKLEFSAFEYYSYTFSLQISDQNSSAVYRKESAESGETNFGEVSVTQSGTILGAHGYTLFLGQLTRLNTNAECPEKELSHVLVRFYYELATKEFVNSTRTGQDGQFNLYVANPEVQGYYTGLIEFQKEGYLSNDLQVNFAVEGKNQQFSIGVVEMVSLNSNEC